MIEPWWLAAGWRCFGRSSCAAGWHSGIAGSRTPWLYLCYEEAGIRGAVVQAAGVGSLCSSILPFGDLRCLRASLDLARAREKSGYDSKVFGGNTECSSWCHNWRCLSYRFFILISAVLNVGLSHAVLPDFPHGARLVTWENGESEDHSLAASSPAREP